MRMHTARDVIALLHSLNGGLLAPHGVALLMSHVAISLSQEGLLFRHRAWSFAGFQESRGAIALALAVTSTRIGQIACQFARFSLLQFIPESSSIWPRRQQRKQPHRHVCMRAVKMTCIGQN